MSRPVLYYWELSERLLAGCQAEGITPEDVYHAMLVAVGRLVAANPAFHTLAFRSVVDAAITQQHQHAVEAAVAEAKSQSLPQWVTDCYPQGEN